MAKQKQELYFKDINSTHCSPLEDHLQDAALEGLEEVILIKAVLNNTKEHIWCTYNGEITERYACTKLLCPYYSSKSGRGVCESRGTLYLYGEEVKFNTISGEIVN